MLTEQQLTYFNTFGFITLRGLFSVDEIKIFNEEFQLKLESKLRFTAPQNEQPKYCSWSNLTVETPVLSKLPKDPRILSIAEQILGEDCFLISCNAGSYVNDTRWHPDCRNFHHHSIKFPIYLQPLDGNNGALRLIPGSHKKPFHDAVSKFNPPGYDDESMRKGDSIRDVPTHACKVEAGDVIIFDAHCWHASWGGNTDRRMLSPIYIKTPKTPEEEDAVYENVKLAHAVRQNLAKNTYAERQPEYPLEWLENAESDPVRQRWINSLHKWGYIESFQEAQTS